jgi:hypothetical protein
MVFAPETNFPRQFVHPGTISTESARSWLFHEMYIYLFIHNLISSRSSSSSLIIYEPLLIIKIEFDIIANSPRLRSG